MGFLGIKGSTWKKVGKIALKAAPIVAAPFTGGASLLALGAGAGALSGALDGGGWKGALLGGGLGAIPGGGAGGAAAGGAAKVGLKEIAKGVAKGAATNFATGTATGLATGQGVKQSLAGGGQGALTGLGTTGGAGGFTQAAKTVGKNVAMNVGGNYASRGLQAAGVPGAIAGEGGNVFSNYLGNQFTPRASGGTGSQFGSGITNLVQQPGQSTGVGGLGSYLPQGSTQGGWKGVLGRAATGAVQGAQGGGGWRGALGGAAQSAGGLPPTGQGQSIQPLNFAGGTSFGGSNAGGSSTPTLGGRTPSGTGNLPSTPVGGGAQVPLPGRPGGVQSPAPKQAADPNRPATWAERYGPLLTQVAGGVVGGVVGRQAQKNAMQRSPEELAALRGAQSAAGDAGRLGGSLARQGRDYMQKPGEYFQTLLGGNRAAMSQAVAAPTAQITGNYRGAERALDQAGVRGASRDQAVADLNRQRVSQIAGLTTGMQPYAAEQLAGMGTNSLQLGVGAMGTAGNIYGNLLGQGAVNREYARGEGAATAGAIGGLARDVGEVAFRRPQQAGVATPPTGVTSARVTSMNPGQPQPPPQQTGGRSARQPRTAQQGIANQVPQGYPFGQQPGDYRPYA